MNRTELSDYRKIFENELVNDILSYWTTYAVDKDGVGFYGAVDLDNRPVGWANKSCVLNARILWTFSAAARQYAASQYAEMAARAYRVLCEDFTDKQFGGYFMELAPDNRVANAIKHTYAQVFVIYALCKFYEFRPSKQLLDTITSLFYLLEEKAKSRDHPGYGEAFTRDWQPLSENRMADHNEPRSMNTHLHVIEAYAALYKIWKEPLVQQRLNELLSLFLDHIIRPDSHLGIFFDLDFNETSESKGICSFGHEIEASWLLWEAAQILADPALIQRTRQASIRMLEAVERVGLDNDGGLFLESTRFGSHLRTNKHWWLQAETLVGFMNGFELTGEQCYWENVKLTWSFIDRYVIDHQRGEWFTKVNRLGQPYLTEPAGDPSPYYRNDWKIDPWKCPYHNGRACLEMIKRIDRLLQTQEQIN